MLLRQKEREEVDHRRVKLMHEFEDKERGRERERGRRPHHDHE